MGILKKLLVLLALVILLPSCATIVHKNIETIWQGYGVSVQYKSTVAIDPDQIPAFINAVNKLEKLLEEKCLTLPQQQSVY